MSTATLRASLFSLAQRFKISPTVSSKLLPRGAWVVLRGRARMVGYAYFTGIEWSVRYSWTLGMGRKSRVDWCARQLCIPTANCQWRFELMLYGGGCRFQSDHWWLITYRDRKTAFGVALEVLPD